MGRIEIDADCRKEQKECGIVSFLLFLSGVYGFLLFFGSIEGIVYNGWIVYPAAAFFGMALWRFWKERRGIFWLSILLSILCFAVAAVMLSGVLRVQFRYVVSCLRGETGLAAVQVTEAALLLSVILSIILFFAEFIAGGHGILYFLTAFLLLVSLMLNVRIQTGALFLLVLFQTGFCAAPKGRRLAAIVLCILFVPALFLTSCFSERLYEAAYRADEFIYHCILFRGEKDINEGVVSYGNNYQTETPRLKLTASLKPTETLYLRGFQGGEYDGGSWIYAEEEKLFECMEEKLNWEQWGYMINGLYSHMYFVMNQNMRTVTPAEPIALTVCHTDGDYGTIYEPYYRRMGRGWGQNAYLNPSGAQSDGGLFGYTYLYYERKDMHIDWNNVKEEFQQPRDWYLEIQTAYLEEAEQIYTQAPKESLPRLTKLVEENLLTETEDITAFILYTLHSNAAYTLTPGWAPLNEDIVEYFLFERKSGYCVHFATAATLMYRLYGIPARYASGYMVQPSDFILREDGNYYANVTDRQAHAWTEIFLPEYGWTPIEATPSSGATETYADAGVGGISGRQRRQKKQDFAGYAPDREYDSLDKDTAKQEDTKESVFDRAYLKVKAGFASHREFFLIIGTCLVFSMLLLPLFLDYGRLRRRRKMEDMDCQTIYTQLFKLLNAHGEFLNANGTEEDFAKKLTGLAPKLTEQEVSLFMQSVSDAAYGPGKEESHLDVERALWVYRCVEEALGEKGRVIE